MQDSLYLNLDKQVGRTVVDVFSKYKPLFYKKGEIIERSDNDRKYAFCTKEGYIIAYSIAPKGQRDIRMISGPSTVFPITKFWAPIESDKYLPSRTIFFEALTDTYVWRCTEKEFNDSLWGHQEIQQAMFKQFCLSHRIQMTRTEMLQIRDIQLKLVSLLLILAITTGKAIGNISHLRAPLSHQLLADCLSVARETVSRQLLLLREKGLIDYHGQSITLLNIHKMKSLVEDY